MARYEHLPLYKTAMELTVSIETVVKVTRPAKRDEKRS
jgi:hypothetical protein